MTLCPLVSISGYANPIMTLNTTRWLEILLCQVRLWFCVHRFLWQSVLICFELYFSNLYIVRIPIMKTLKAGLVLYLHSNKYIINDCQYTITIFLLNSALLHILFTFMIKHHMALLVFFCKNIWEWNTTQGWSIKRHTVLWNSLWEVYHFENNYFVIALILSETCY